MWRYASRRTLAMIPTAVIVSLITFFGLQILPGETALLSFSPFGAEGSGGMEEYVEAFNEKFGFNEPLPIRYVTWVRGMLTGSPGTSIRTEKPMWMDIKVRFPVTLHILMFSLFFSGVFGVTAGLLAAVFQDSWLDYFVRVFAVFAGSFPSFFLLTLLLLLPAIWFRYAPPVGYVPIWEDPWRGLRMFVPPTFLLALGSAFTVRMTRSSLLEVLRSDFVRTARAKGLDERTVILRHAMRNAMIPVVTILGGEFAVLLGGSVILEQIMDLPGLGNYFLQAIFARDINVVMAMTMYAAMTVMTINLLVDLSYAYFDPRIRYR
jgi:peptide/nickel transport system permease protein